MDFDSVHEDVAVAAAAAGCLVALALADRFVLGADPGPLVELVPAYVYFAYLFTRKGGPYASVDTPRNWALLVVIATLLTFGYVAV